MRKRLRETFMKSACAAVLACAVLTSSMPAGAAETSRTVYEKLAAKYGKQLATMKKSGLWCAHRGYSDMAPANTAVAFKIAGFCGAAMIETDVQMSKDGKLYTAHDKTLSSMSSSNSTFLGMNSGDIDRLAVTKGTNAKVFGTLKFCTYRNYLDICKRFGCVSMTELKEYGGYGEELAKKVFKDIKAAGMQKKTIVVSYSPNMILAFRKADPTGIVPCARLRMSADEDLTKWEKARRTKNFHDTVGEVYPHYCQDYPREIGKLKGKYK